MKMLISAGDKLAFYGDQKKAIQAMLDYEYACGKPATDLVCIIVPTLARGRQSLAYFYGSSEVHIPAVRTVGESASFTPQVLVNFASPRSAAEVSQQALAISSLRTVVIVAEGMSERETRELRVAAKKTGVAIIGPASVGILSAGLVKVGNAGGTVGNIIRNRLTERGTIAIVSKSGGMLNELMGMVTRVGNGVAEAVAIGGDRYPCTTLSEQVLRYETQPEIDLILVLGEVGGTQELDIAEMLASGKLTKPVVAWVSGTGATSLPGQIQFGHAGAMANADQETAAYKLAALRNAGAIVPESFAGLADILEQTTKKLGIGCPEKAQVFLPMPEDLQVALKQGSVRHTKGIISSITPTRSGETTYLGKPIDKVAREASIGHLLGLLWFKREFPVEVADLFELILKLVADHGPAVSGAHNTIVAARAGKDLVSSVVSGLLTIGPRFGGAVNQAAVYVYQAVRDSQTPYAFVADMKAQGIPIPGIGHRVKSVTNPDPRVSVLKEAAGRVSVNHVYLDYFLAVELITTRKKESLILNVDGTIAVILLDVISQYMTAAELEELLRVEALNSFFVLGRSIGLIGHYIDQNRLGQPLYRHPGWDIGEEI